MKKNIFREKLIILIVIFAICVLNLGGNLLINTSVVFAADASDYDFTDELDEDRVGIGFIWTAENRTLKITGIKNKSAIVKLPDNSTIDIQGNIENYINGLKCEGNLVIKGNNVSSLKITGCSCSTPIGYLSSMYIYDNLTIKNGNVKIESSGIGYSMSQLTYAGIYCKKIIIDGGEFDVNIGGLRSGSQILYAVFNNEKIILNDGTIHIESEEGTGIRGKCEINGGFMEVITGKTYNAFKEVPSINPTIDWKISYSNNSETEEIEADITDIYNIYNSSIIKISKAIMIGDLDGDGKVNIKDLNRLYGYLNETSELTEQELKYADVNGDGKVNIKDWNRLYEHISEVNPLF